MTYRRGYLIISHGSAGADDVTRTRKMLTSMLQYEANAKSNPVYSANGVGLAGL